MKASAYVTRPSPFTSGQRACRGAAVGVAVRVGVAGAIPGVCVATGSADVGVAVRVGVCVAVAVRVGVCVAVCVGVAVGVWVTVAVGVDVNVGVDVGGAVFVAVAVAVGVAVGPDPIQIVTVAVDCPPRLSVPSSRIEYIPGANDDADIENDGPVPMNPPGVRRHCRCPPAITPSSGSMTDPENRIELPSG